MPVAIPTPVRVPVAQPVEVPVSRPYYVHTPQHVPVKSAPQTIVVYVKGGGGGGYNGHNNGGAGEYSGGETSSEGNYEKTGHGALQYIRFSKGYTRPATGSLKGHYITVDPSNSGHQQHHRENHEE